MPTSYQMQVFWMNVRLSIWFCYNQSYDYSRSIIWLAKISYNRDKIDVNLSCNVCMVIIVLLYTRHTPIIRPVYARHMPVICPSCNHTRSVTFLVDFTIKRLFMQLWQSVQKGTHHGTGTSKKPPGTSTTSSSPEATSWKCARLGTGGTRRKKADSEKTLDLTMDCQMSWVWFL